MIENLLSYIMLYLNKELKKFGHVRTNVLLSKYATFKIGGPAQFLVEVDNNDSLVGLLNFLSGEGIKFLILGGGSNLLFPDSGFEGVVIKIKTSNIKVLDETIECDAGASLGTVINLAAQNSLGGMEWAAGIPGTVGGAVRGNAGAMGKDAEENIDKVEIWRNGATIILSNNECGFMYRGSAFKANRQDVILRVWFKLKKVDQKQIMLKMQEYLLLRQGKFPAFPSAGSFFKNIKLADWQGDKKILPEIFLQRGSVPVGYLVDQVGMRGFAVGGAKVAEEHGNFIINYDKAEQNDVLAIV